MDSALIVQESAMRTSIGFVVIRDGAVVWVNDAARSLVEPYGGGWSGSAAPLDLLADVPPGGRTVVNWLPTHGNSRWWRVTCTAIDVPLPALLYEIVDHTTETAPDRVISAATPHWRLDRLEALARMGSWVWSIPEERLEWSEALLTMFGHTARVGTGLRRVPRHAASRRRRRWSMRRWPAA